ncbi:hypothetical protein P3T36_007271 [Kitasatospora sp. MAP12-15]|uniref:ATP-binding protein n=1 Tax=unclassified Kitasatospora TaxID=2633591 RepID=UPI0024750A20|nr:ATP-binding protein [Kitasatospora sp. MAP12-44]MDH6115654.1 hypothetical protein [Kitasatospora sp. MAP12-44]
MTATVNPGEVGLGFYLQDRASGFTAHVIACRGNLARLRELSDARLSGVGVCPELVDDAKLLVSELVGNAVRLCGDFVPLVVEVYAERSGVWVTVHDPDSESLPRRSAALADNLVAECGRGLYILDVLAPGWQVLATPVGKQIRCRLPYEMSAA